MITTDKMTNIQTLIQSIAETVQDRERLISEAAEREKTIDQLNEELAHARERIIEIEARNTRLVDDVMMYESMLADADARFASIRQVATHTPNPQRTERTDGASVIAFNGSPKRIEHHGEDQPGDSEQH